MEKSGSRYRTSWPGPGASLYPPLACSGQAAGSVPASQLLTPSPGPSFWLHPFSLSSLVSAFCTLPRAPGPEDPDPGRETDPPGERLAGQLGCASPRPGWAWLGLLQGSSQGSEAPGAFGTPTGVLPACPSPPLPKPHPRASVPLLGPRGAGWASAKPGSPAWCHPLQPLQPLALVVSALPLSSMLCMFH